MPFAAVRTIDKLEKLSLVAMSMAIFGVGALIANAICIKSSMRVDKHKRTLLVDSVARIFYGLPSVAGSWCLQFNALPIYTSLGTVMGVAAAAAAAPEQGYQRPPAIGSPSPGPRRLGMRGVRARQRAKDMQYVATLTSLVILVAYGAAALSVYAVWGSDIGSDFLTRIDPTRGGTFRWQFSNQFAKAVGLSMITSGFITIPLFAFESRTNLIAVWHSFQRTRRMRERQKRVMKVAVATGVGVGVDCSEEKEANRDEVTERSQSPSPSSLLKVRVNETYGVSVAGAASVEAGLGGGTPVLASSSSPSSTRTQYYKQEQQQRGRVGAEMLESDSEDDDAQTGQEHVQQVADENLDLDFDFDDDEVPETLRERVTGGLLVCVTAALAALFAKNLNVLVTLCGAIYGVFIAYVLPSVVFLKGLKQVRPHLQTKEDQYLRWLCYFTLLMGALVAIAGIIAVFS